MAKPFSDLQASSPVPDQLQEMLTQLLHKGSPPLVQPPRVAGCCARQVRHHTIIRHSYSHPVA